MGRRYIQLVPLSEAQRRLAEENHKLIYQFLRDCNLPLDEFYDIAALGLCKAAQGYDARKGVKFATYAYRVMLNEIRMDWRRDNALIRKGITIVSFDDPIPDTENGLTHGDTIPGRRGDPEAVAEAAEIKAKIANLTPLFRRVAELRALDYTQEQIAAEIGVSKSYISRILIHIKQYLEDDGSTPPGRFRNLTKES